MSKTFICKELGGVCDAEFTGNSLQEIIQKGMPHMMSDRAHQLKIKNVEKDTGENRTQWMTRMQNIFESKSEDK